KGDVMITDLFESAARVQSLREGPAGTLLEAFAQVLVRNRYAAITARRHLRAAEHFVHWADRRRIAVTGAIGPALDRFGRHLQRARRCPHFGHTFRVQILHGARLFLMHLQDAGLIDRSAVESPVATQLLIAGFCQWMHQQRGTCESTLSNYTRHLRELLTRVGEEPSTWDARSLREFVLEGSRMYGWATAKQRTTALRMFLRFVIAEGRCASGLTGAVPVLVHRRLSSLPRYLSADDVERVIASCDTASAVGQRDRAILLLLARLGLRAGDIVQLRLRDIDWRAAWIHVTGKGRRETRLPLTREVGDALVAYLTQSRPETDTDVVFVRSRAPFRAFRSHCAVSVIVDRAFARAGVTRPSRGAAHLLRHSIATSMLRHGASLHDVAALLRHQSVTTTEIYAKVDVTALRTIAQPWPEVQPW
ncbi:MAG: site-specific integrase, partial [Vicinamibacterales bacterium]